ncbi:MAG TPA: tetratricopeptide repeat protein [Candidatus Udaeobacter sp.]|nr:tetratricopeptide repeat protein [Candidatus Udaeobacter sp.]
MPVREIGVSRWRREWLWALLLIPLVFIAYAQVFRAGFIWDDESHLTQNPCVVGPLGLKEIWTTTQAVYYPLVLTTFWALHKFVGLNPLPYHILNVLMHAVSAILLWRVLRQLNVRGAWLGAALWAIHPVMVQSVAWVTELKNTQSGVFYLLSILFFLKWEDQGGAVSRPSQRETTDRRSLVIALSLLFFLLAILSKPSTVMLPIVLALCIWWRRERIQRRDFLALVPFALISAVASIWTVFEQKFHAGAIGGDWAQTRPERLIIAGKAIWFYLGKLAWPHPLIFIYPRWDVDSSKVVAYLPLLAAIAGLVALWFIRAKSGRALFFAAAYYVVSLFPVLGFFDVFFFRYSFVSDHFQYLASMGPLALAGAAIVTAVGRFGELRKPSRADTAALQFPGNIAVVRSKSLLLPAIPGIFLLSLVFLTWRQTAVYHDLVTLYTATLQKNPGCWMAHYNLGIILREQGDVDQALEHYRQAFALRPNYAEAHYNLARCLVEKGQLDDAIEHYEKALKISPADPETHNNLGVTLFGMGRVDDAIVHYQKALAIWPGYAAAACNLANALIVRQLPGDLDDAIARYSMCLAQAPDQAEAQYNLASALLRKGRIDEAIIHYEKALELLPGNADAHANLGSALLAKGRIAEAIGQYKEALTLAPENVAAQSNLAWLLATSPDPSLRNGPEAVLLAEQASRSSDGKRPLALRILAAAYAEAGRFSEAKATAHEALQAADDQGNAALSDFLRREIALYESGQPYHKQAR